MVLAVVRGIALAGAVLVALGTVACVGVTVHRWPSDDGPTTRARHLGEGISQGMHIALLASVVVVPAAVVWSVRRRRGS